MKHVVKLRMLYFISLNTEWCNAMKERFRDIDGVCVIEGDVRQIPVDHTVFVSPANSLGFMDGGIDMVLSRELFPGIQRRVQQKIRELGLQTALGRYYLPVGSACFVPAANTSGIIVAPTMFLPHDVSATQNAYWSTMAALQMWETIQIPNLVLSSHCCGYGRMPSTESAVQMKRAYDDFMAGNKMTPLRVGDQYMLFPNRDDEQPNNYDNREIKEIYIG